LTHSYRFISEHRADFGVTRLCRVLQVRRPGFYEWLAAAPARAERALTALAADCPNEPVPITAIAPARVPAAYLSSPVTSEG